MDTREQFAKKSLEKAKNFDDDPFIQFIILYLGLNALYGGFQVEREGEKLKSLFQSNKEIITQVLKSNTNQINKIAVFIEDTPQHNRLREFLRTRKRFIDRQEYSDGSLIDFAEFLNKVRNNMFHAGKLWEEKIEDDLLRMVNPLVYDILCKLVLK